MNYSLYLSLAMTTDIPPTSPQHDETREPRLQAIWLEWISASSSVHIYFLSFKHRGYLKVKSIIKNSHLRESLPCGSSISERTQSENNESISRIPRTCISVMLDGLRGWRNDQEGLHTQSITDRWINGKECSHQYWCVSMNFFAILKIHLVTWWWPHIQRRLEDTAINTEP